MKKLDELLPDIRPVAGNVITLTQQAGQSSSENRLLPSERPQEKQNLPWDQVPIRGSWEAQDNLTQLLYQVYSLQKTYGDKALGIEGKDDFFQHILADFPFWEIKAAFMEYVKKNSDIPTPSDIIGLIEMARKERERKIISDAERYKTVKSIISKGGERYLNQYDYDFIREYEAKQ